MIDSAKNDKINSISGSLNIVSEEFEIQNSNGLNYSENASYISGLINTESNFGSFNVSGIGQECSRMLNSFDPEKIGGKAKQMCLESINPISCENSQHTIIFEPYAFGELLAFVIAPNFNLKTYFENRSCFSQKINKKISTENFSIVDDPHVPDGIGSKILDDEGTPTKSQFLIENGIMKNTYSDLFSAYKESQKSSGNASRPGSPMGRYAEPTPTASPHNLSVKGPTMTEDELIKETKHGILVGRLWYTYPVNPIKGDFSCTARSGIKIIENGEIKNPAKPARIIHNLFPLFENISGIGDNSKNVIQWASLPSITPSVKADGIMINPI